MTTAYLNMQPKPFTSATRGIPTRGTDREAPGGLGCPISRSWEVRIKMHRPVSCPCAYKAEEPHGSGQTFTTSLITDTGDAIKRHAQPKSSLHRPETEPKGFR